VEFAAEPRSLPPLRFDGDPNQVFMSDDNTTSSAVNSDPCYTAQACSQGAKILISKIEETTTMVVLRMFFSIGCGRLIVAITDFIVV
jgi:hypothetical protein